MGILFTQTSRGPPRGIFPGKFQNIILCLVVGNTSHLDTVSTGSGSDLVNDESQNRYDIAR
jgi:hypothetical protein